MSKDLPETYYVCSVRTFDDGTIIGMVISRSDHSIIYSPSISLSDCKAYCDCKAGNHGKPCWHLKAIIKKLEDEGWNVYEIFIKALYSYRTSFR